MGTPEDIARILEGLRSPLTGLLASGGAFIAGIGLLADDLKDFGDLDTPDHPSPFHHWIWGVMVMLGGMAGMGFNLLRLLQMSPPPQGVRIPRSLVEGLPPEIVERFR